jgi:hypothetical protein
MGYRGTAIALGALAATLSGCPAIVGLDGNYSSGGGHGSDGSDGPLADGAVSGDGGHHGGGKHDGSAGDAGGGVDTGKDDSGGSGDSSKPSDSGHPPPTDACPVACSLTAPSGWTLVAYEQSQSDSCPSGFTQTEVVEPTSAGSCTCGSCDLTAEPNCYPVYPVTITSMWNLSGGTVCDGTGGYFITNGGACVTDALGNATYSSFTGPGPVAGSGTCTSTASGSGPSTTAERICTPTECASDACESSLGSSFTTCLFQAGDQTCPGPLTKHSVGSSADVSCGSCDCSVSATGCDGTMSIYDSTSSCGGSAAAIIPTNGTCTALPTALDPMGGYSYVYTATPTGVSCNAGTASATVNISGQGTVCCP